MIRPIAQYSDVVKAEWGRTNPSRREVAGALITFAATGAAIRD
jgi:hypothetical protein